MINENANPQFIKYDDCGDQLDLYEAPTELTWMEIYEYAKGEGWQARKIDGEWLHLCPSCIR